MCSQTSTSLLLQFIHSLDDLFIQTLGFKMTRLHQCPAFQEQISMLARDSEIQKDTERTMDGRDTKENK